MVLGSMVLGRLSMHGGGGAHGDSSGGFEPRSSPGASHSLLS